jgi:S1-C subfamily serine protease
MFGIIGQTLVDFNDSHTRFVPPGRAVSINYGWQMQSIGDAVYVVAVKPGSDADNKGVKPGDKC